MSSKQSTLFKQVFVITIVPLLVFGVSSHLTTHFLIRKNFDNVITQLQNNLDRTSEDMIAQMLETNREYAIDLIKEIKLAAGDSLIPRERVKFIHLAEKQKDLDQIKEFALYEGKGKLKYSSIENTVRREIPRDIIAQAKQTKKLVIRGQEASSQSLHLYEPLLATPDIARLAPQYKVGEIYSLLYVELSKERIANSIQMQQGSIDEALNGARASYKNALSQLQWITVVFLGIFLLSLVVVLLPVISRKIICPIRRTIEMLTGIFEGVSDVSENLDKASHSLATMSSEEAEGLDEASESLEEMAKMTKENAKNAQEVNRLATEAQNAANNGSVSMQKMNDAIRDIHNSSEETGKIINTIDDIAFQTNLLALNAAVEAARAGEAGKGFAVVAEEVRSLAMKSAQAAHDTTVLIKQAINNANNGVEIAKEVGSVLDEIVTGVSKTSGLTSEIAEASREQSIGIDQINQNVAQMDKIMQIGAHNAEQTANASEKLNNGAHKMNTVVDHLIAMVGAHRIHHETPKPPALRKAQVKQTRQRRKLVKTNR